MLKIIISHYYEYIYVQYKQFLQIIKKKSKVKSLYQVEKNILFDKINARNIVYSLIKIRKATTMKYLLRSMLFVPSYNEKFLNKAITCEADAIIFDMEDAVPKAKRPEARATLKKYLDKGVFRGKQLFIRVNQLGTDDLPEDLKLITDNQITGIVVPKITDVGNIKAFEALLDFVENREGLERGSLKLLPLIENAQAVINVDSIAAGSNRNIAILFGGEDYLDSVSGINDCPRRAFEMPRTMIVMAARTHGLLPIDTPYLDLKNEEGFLEEEYASVAMGFAGCLIVNPVQLPWCNKVFTPSEEEIAHAKDMIAEVNKIQAAGGSVAVLNGKMIGPPMLKRANKVMALVELIEEFKREK